MKEQNTLKRILGSDNFAIWLAILSVIVQSFHSFTAFYNMSSLHGTPWGVAQAIVFAVIIDLAILFYTVRKNEAVTFGAAFVMVTINAYYYYQHLGGVDGITPNFLFGCFLSLIVPFSVYFYSHEIGKVQDPEKPTDGKEEQFKKDLLDLLDDGDMIGAFKLKYKRELHLRKIMSELLPTNKVVLTDEVRDNIKKSFEHPIIKPTVIAETGPEIIDTPSDTSLMDIHEETPKNSGAYNPTTTGGPGQSNSE